MLIPHTTPLIPARFRQRFDRFIADVQLKDGAVVSAHCVNPGRMEGMVRPGAPVWISPAPEGSKRKLRWTLELMEIDGMLVGANTQVPNRIAEMLIRERQIPGLRRWRALKREVPYGDGSRIDLLLQGARDHLVEVKNCHLVYPDRRAYFPDSVSVRAAKHLEELTREARDGKRATVLFILQRPDGRSLRPSQLHDPAFASAARKAGQAGVQFRAARIEPTLEGFRFQRMIPVDLSPYDELPLHAYREQLMPWSGWRRRGRSGG